MKIRHRGHIWEAYLEDDGSLDTSVSIRRYWGIGNMQTDRLTFSQEYASQFRDRAGRMTRKGFRELAKEVIEYSEKKYTEDN